MIKERGFCRAWPVAINFAGEAASRLPPRVRDGPGRKPNRLANETVLGRTAFRRVLSSERVGLEDLLPFRERSRTRSRIAICLLRSQAWVGRRRRLSNDSWWRPGPVSQEGRGEEGRGEARASEEDRGQEDGSQEDRSKEGTGEENGSEEGTGEEDRGEEGRGQEDDSQEDRSEEGTGEESGSQEVCRALVAEGEATNAGSDQGKGMTLRSIRDRYAFYTGKASDIVRQLAFAAIALIWIFRGNTGTHLPRDLLVVAILIVVALVCDLVQYIVGSVLWGNFERSKEAELLAAGGLDERAEFDYPAGINLWTARLFHAKWVLLAAAYVVLGVALGRRI